MSERTFQNKTLEKIPADTVYFHKRLEKDPAVNGTDNTKQEN